MSSVDKKSENNAGLECFLDIVEGGDLGEFCRFLGKQGAKLSENDLFIGLIVAVLRNRAEIIRLMAGYGVNIDDVDSDGTAPLLWGCRNEKEEANKCLAELGADLSDIRDAYPEWYARLKAHQEFWCITEGVDGLDGCSSSCLGYQGI